MEYCSDMEELEAYMLGGGVMGGKYPLPEVQN